MHYHNFGRTGRPVSNIGFGAWQIGGSWGSVSEEDGSAALHAALDSGINFIDTADVYGDGRSEKIIADVLAKRGGQKPFVATKAGRRLDPHIADGYNLENLEGFVDRSLRNLRMERLDLLQLHCPPTEAFYRPEVFEALDALKAKGKLANYGVSVEKVEEALKAIEFPGVASVQIIYNIFRQRPASLFLPEAKRRNVAVIVRVPLASGLLSGKITRDTVFDKEDHRNFNRKGDAFDVGETFAGVPFEIALDAVEEVRKHVPRGTGMAAFALRWILMNEAVTVAIPGARNAEQAKANASASDLPVIGADVMAAMEEIYRSRIAAHVHQRW